MHSIGVNQNRKRPRDPLPENMTRTNRSTLMDCEGTADCGDGHGPWPRVGSSVV